MRRKDATLASDIGARLRAIRVQNGWKQKDLAERLGITQAQLSKYEAGKMLPSVDTLFDICLELHLRWEELIPLHDTGRSKLAVDVDIRQLTRAVEHLPVHYRNQAAEVLRLILSSAREEGAEESVKPAAVAAGGPKSVPTITIPTHQIATVPTTPTAFGVCGPISPLIAKPTGKTVCGFTPNSSIAQTATTAAIWRR